MKKPFFALCVAALLAACSSFSNRGELDRPFIETANQNYFSIEKIAVTDSSTTLYAVVHYMPGQWVSIADSSFITADGIDYTLASTEGIEAGERVTMPDSGVIHFALHFPAVPADVESIDFAESKDSGWKLWGIDLTGKDDHRINIGKVPAELRRTDPDATLPQPVVAFGDSTTINVHILGYRTEMGDKFMWVLNTLHGQIGADSPVDVDAQGNATVKVAISAPAQFIGIGFYPRTQLSGSALLSPGETVDLYLDSHVAGEWNMSVRDSSNFGMPKDYYPYFVSGTYANSGHHTGRTDYSMQFYSGEFGDYRMNGDEYTEYVINLYKTLGDSLAADSSLSPMGREINRINLQSDLIYAAVDAWNILRRNYYSTHNNWGSKVHPDTVPVKLSAENVKAFADLIDFNDTKLLISHNARDIYDTRLWKDAGIDPGILESLNLYNQAYEAADDARLDTAAIDALRKLSAPMADEAEAHYRARKAALEALDLKMLATTPDVAPDKLFEAIVAPHRGKVVMVDFWNTWCAPCRAAIAQNEPEKSGDLASDDIVWIYIADESSPMPTYMSMIKDIRGIHYRVDKDQIAALRNQFDVDGIPYYVLVDRSGRATGRPDLRNHAAFKKALQKAL